jgi:hypothetical protein
MALNALVGDEIYAHSGIYLNFQNGAVRNQLTTLEGSVCVLGGGGGGGAASYFSRFPSAERSISQPGIAFFVLNFILFCK